LRWRALRCPDAEPQRVVVDIVVVPGPFITAVGERRSRVEFHGRISAW